MNQNSTYTNDTRPPQTVVYAMQMHTCRKLFMLEQVELKGY